MKNISKSLLSFVIALLMFITMLPAFSAFASGTEVDLIKDENGVLKEGVYITFYGGEFNANSSGNNQENAYDGDVSTSWTSAWSPQNPAYAQVNFPVSQQFTKIRLMMSADSYFRDSFKVLVSNDMTFTDFTEVYNQGSTPLASGTWLEIDMTSYSESFKYVKIIRSSSLYNFINISEIEVYGYSEDLPDVSGDSVLTDVCDVTAESSEPLSKSFLAQNVLDGDESTGTFALGGEDAYVQIDLKRKMPISKVGFLNFQHDYVSTRINFDIVASNDVDFASGTVLYSRNGDEVAKGEWVYAYGTDDTPYRYIRIRKNATSETKSDYEMTNFHQFLCIAEVKVWGTEPENLIIKEFSQEALVSATTENTPASHSTDGDVRNTVWNNGDETGKAAITYTLNNNEVVTSFGIFPEYDNDDAHKNFKIWASESGVFDDSVLIGEAGDVPIKKGAYTFFDIEELNAYKAFKIESTIDNTPQNVMGIAEVMICYDNTKAQVEVVKSSPYDSETDITNIDGKNNFIEIELNRNIDAKSVNPETVIITNKNNNVVVSEWELYCTEGKTAKIDISKLSSNTEYEVLVTTGVTASNVPISNEYVFSFTTGIILNVPYTEGKIIKNIAQNKEIKGTIFQGSGPMTNMIDGKDSTYAYGNPNYQVDLGNFYDILAIELVPQSESPDNNWLLQGLNVLGSKIDMDILNMSAEKANSLKLGTYPSNSTKKETMVFDVPQRLRYIGLWRAGTYIVLSEMRVYALVDNDFGPWEVTKDGTKTDIITTAGTYSFSVPVTNYAGAKTYYMTLCAVDENGALISVKCYDVTEQNGKISKSITVDEKADSVYAMLFEDRNSSKLVCDTKIISKTDKPIIDGDKGGIIYNSSDDGFKLTITSEENSEFTETDRLSVVVLKPGKTFKESLSDDEFDNSLFMARGINSLSNGKKRELAFEIKENAPYGKYNIKATVTREDFTLADKYFTYNNIDPDEVVECVNIFKNYKEADGSMETLLKKYVDEKEFIAFEQIEEIYEKIPENFEKYYEYFKDLYCTSKEMTKITDVVNCLNGAYIICMFDEGNADKAKELLKKYPLLLADYYDSNCDTEKFITVFSDIKENIKNAESLKSILNWSCVLSYIQDGNAKSVRYTIENNSSLLGCDIAYAQNKGISLNQIAMNIDTKKASNYYDVGLGAEFKKIVDELANEIPQGSGSVGGGKGSSGGGGFSKVVSSKDAQAPVVSNENTDKPIINNAFNDIDNVLWAKEYILMLHENGIVAGDENGNFNPDKKITREEFIKMIVVSLELDAVTGVNVVFDDCDKRGWYYPYVQIASSNKIIKGIDRNNFGVGQFIKRQDMAVILAKALEVKNINSIEKELSFTDTGDISDYAQSAVSKMNSIGLLNGFDDGSFRPNETTTRAQAAVIIGKMLKYLKEVAK